MQEYRQHLKNGLQTYFDIQEDYVLGKDKFEMFATFNQRNAKYMLLKNVEVYAFTNNEYIFHKKLDRTFEDSDIKWLDNFLDKHINEIVVYDKEHMSSTVTFIFEADMPHPDIQKKISKYKYYKSFMFGFKGWVNAKLMLIDPTRSSGITNKLGKNDLERFVMN